MPDHKFEPFQRVLVRSSDSSTWVASHFSHIERGLGSKIICTSGLPWNQCIPYTPETAHLLGTSQPYEPPKPPVDESKRFKAGEIVEIRWDHMWCSVIYLEYEQKTKLHKVYDLGEHYFYHKPPSQIRPLPDSAAQ